MYNEYASCACPALQRLPARSIKTVPPYREGGGLTPHWCGALRGVSLRLPPLVRLRHSSQHSQVPRAPMSGGAGAYFPVGCASA